MSRCHCLRPRRMWSGQHWSSPQQKSTGPLLSAATPSTTCRGTCDGDRRSDLLLCQPWSRTEALLGGSPPGAIATLAIYMLLLNQHSRPSSHRPSRATHHATNAVVPCSVRETLVTRPCIRKFVHLITLVDISSARADKFLLSEIPRQAVGARRVVTVQVQSQICKRAICDTSILFGTVASKPSKNVTVLKP